MELSETNHNTFTGYTHIGQPRSICGCGAHFWAVQGMNHQLNPTTTLITFGTNTTMAVVSVVSPVLRTRARPPMGMETGWPTSEHY